MGTFLRSLRGAMPGAALFLVGRSSVVASGFAID
jgi:hypothetical protein